MSGPYRLGVPQARGATAVLIVLFRALHAIQKQHGTLCTTAQLCRGECIGRKSLGHVITCHLVQSVDQFGAVHKGLAQFVVSCQCCLPGIEESVRLSVSAKLRPALLPIMGHDGITDLRPKDLQHTEQFPVTNAIVQGGQDGFADCDPAADAIPCGEQITLGECILGQNGILPRITDIRRKIERVHRGVERRLPLRKGLCHLG